MKDQFISSALLPTQAETSPYIIIIKYQFIGNDGPVGNPDYYYTMAEYKGTGLWQEYDEIELPIISMKVDHALGTIYQSSGCPLIADSEYVTTPEGVWKQVSEVIAYWKIPELPDFLEF